MKPHKHAKLIKAWADGAEIERRRIDGTDEWIAHDGAWDIAASFEFRIKPEPKPNFVHYLELNMFGISTQTSERWATDNLKITFDGTTGKPIKAEVL